MFYFILVWIQSKWIDLYRDFQKLCLLICLGSTVTFVRYIIILQLIITTILVAKFSFIFILIPVLIKIITLLLSIVKYMILICFKILRLCNFKISLHVHVLIIINLNSIFFYAISWIEWNHRKSTLIWFYSLERPHNLICFIFCVCTILGFISVALTILTNIYNNYLISSFILY